ncbi:hypothetical protein [Tenacibaculum maritimum]|uniref:hypothetical protein n=1 Tax=Tenacibaculum maritimum TaxID=107401 RepID=UPI00388F7DDE
MKNSVAELTKGSFLPNNYQLPDKSKQFMKIEVGDNIVRFLSNPLIGWVFFSEDKKPIRRAYDESSPTLGDFSKEELVELKAKKRENGEFEGSRHFWIALVWDYKTESPKILEITQITIIRSLIALFNDSDWGDLRKYDVNIQREGTGRFDTEFTIIQKPHKPLNKEIVKTIETLESNNLLDLTAIWRGEYPFEKYLY